MGGCSSTWARIQARSECRRPLTEFTCERGAEGRELSRDWDDVRQPGVSPTNPEFTSGLSVTNSEAPQVQVAGGLDSWLDPTQTVSIACTLPEAAPAGDPDIALHRRQSDISRLPERGLPGIRGPADRAAPVTFFGWAMRREGNDVYSAYLTVTCPWCRRAR